MKRFHVHVSVNHLEESIRFYSALFGAAPAVVKEDYAKWMLDDPRVNFAISARGDSAGVNHLGLQVDNGEELAALRGQATAAEIAGLEQTGAACCYAKSDKYWVTDPQGVAWETFHTLDSIPVFGSAGESADSAENAAAAGCCVPSPAKVGAEKAAACCG
jgi:catechol 2,3-dioxygenase-like lactoylglutathione lyase family enzyme